MDQGARAPTGTWTSWPSRCQAVVPSARVMGGDALLGQAPAGRRGACTGGAHHEEVPAVDGRLQGGQGLLQVVERDVVGAGQVAGGVLAGRADVDDGQLVQASVHLGGGEGGAGCHWGLSFALHELPLR
jgi:hypothetical protein